MSGRGVKTAFQGRAKQILIRIADNSGGIQTNQLVDMLGVERPNVGAYVSLLREEGFITSSKSGNDKRFVYHSLTIKGRHFLDGLAGGSSSELVKDLTSPAEREAEKRMRSQAQNEDLDKLLDDSENLLSEKEKFDFNDEGEMSF